VLFKFDAFLPVNLMKDLLDLNKRAWDNIARIYDDKSETPISDIFDVFTGMLPVKGRVLDLGCGTGLPYARILVEKGFDVLGVDLSGEMVKVASENVPEASFVQLSMNEMTYRDEFDGVMSSFSMLLLPPDLFKETASRIYSALVEGGYFYLSLNEPASISGDPDSEVFEYHGAGHVFTSIHSGGDRELLPASWFLACEVQSRYPCLRRVRRRTRH
jgi:SAM-dependent methyltransferase